MGDITYAVRLAASEIVLLDGRCGAEAQSMVDLAKSTLRISAEHGLDEGASRYVAEVVRTARQTGRLVLRPTRMDCRCPVTGEAPPMVRKSRRSTEMVRAPLPAYELADGFVHVIGHPRLGVTHAGLELVRPALRIEMADVEAEYPDKLLGQPSPWRREAVMACSHCGWSGRDGLMPRHLFSRCRRCPECGAQEREMEFGKRTFETQDGFCMVPADTAPPPKYDPCVRSDADSLTSAPLPT